MKATQQVPNPRRHAILKALQATREGTGFQELWWTKQLETPGTALPSGFPNQAELADCGYFVVEDLDGAIPDELREAGLTAAQATAVLEAFAAL